LKTLKRDFRVSVLCRVLYRIDHNHRHMIVLQGLRLALAGVVCGIAAAFGLTRLISSFLFGVKEWDPLVFLGVPVVLLAVALLAVWMPAMRAGRVDPIQALRHD
jgi:putative ABC transport system permease protein